MVDAWVSPSSPGPNAENKRIDTGEGWLTVAVRARNIGGLDWRYDYVVMNHSFDRRIKSFAGAGPRELSVGNLRFHDVDRNPATDWIPTSGMGFVAGRRRRASRMLRRTGACSTPSAS